MRSTYTGELDAAVTAFRCSALLLDVQVSEVATRGLDDANLVRLGVVPIAISSMDALIMFSSVCSIGSVVASRQRKLCRGS